MKTKGLFIIILLMFATTTALFAGGFALSGIGSKAIGMGGAFRGLADDPTAMYWNPAGLGFMDESCIAVAGAGIMPTSEFTSKGSYPGFAFNTKIKAEKKTWMFPNAYAVYASESPVKLGLGVYVPYGLGAKWDAYNLPDSMMTTTGMKPLNWSAGFPEKEMESSIGIVDIHPTVSLKVFDNFAFGAGVSINYGMITIGKLVPHSAYSYYLPTTMYLDGTGWGIGANAGMLWKANEILQIGVSGKLPSEVKIKGDAKIRTWLSDVINYGLHGNNIAYYTPAVVGDTTDAEATLKLPGDCGIGLSLKPNPKWTIDVDFAYTWWSVLNSVKIELDSINILGNPITEKELNTKWFDTFRYSIGTQYQLLNTMAFRLGFFYDQSPIPDKSLSPTWPDVNEKLSGNIGLGFKFGKLGLDLNYEYIKFTERNIKTAAEDNIVGLYNTSISAANFGLTYKF
jgi:long-chain fatty acid transport protein